MNRSVASTGTCPSQPPRTTSARRPDGAARSEAVSGAALETAVGVALAEVAPSEVTLSEVATTTPSLRRSELRARPWSHPGPGAVPRSRPHGPAALPAPVAVSHPAMTSARLQPSRSATGHPATTYS